MILSRKDRDALVEIRQGIVKDQVLNNLIDKNKINLQRLKETLLDRVNEIDRIKRDIKVQITMAHEDWKAKVEDLDRVWLRKAKDKINHLTVERDTLTIIIGRINKQIKAFRRESNGRLDVSIESEFMNLVMDELGDEAKGFLSEAKKKVQKFGGFRKKLVIHLVYSDEEKDFSKKIKGAFFDKGEAEKICTKHYLHILEITVS